MRRVNGQKSPFPDVPERCRTQASAPLLQPITRPTELSIVPAVEPVTPTSFAEEVMLEISSPLPCIAVVVSGPFAVLLAALTRPAREASSRGGAVPAVPTVYYGTEQGCGASEWGLTGLVGELRGRPWPPAALQSSAA